MESIIKALGIDSVQGMLIQLIGLFGLAMAMLSYQMKTQKQIVMIQIISWSFFTVHFYLLGAYTGALLNLIGAIRSVVFANKDKKWGRSKWWIVFFSLLFL